MRCALAVWMLSSCAAVWAGRIDVTDQYPLRGQATEIIVSGDDGSPLDAVVVHLTYRPNSMVALADSLPPTDASGTTVWTPSDAGICTIRVLDGDVEVAAKDVSVRFDRFPIQGAIVMIVAFCALFGGAAFSLVMLFKAEQEGKDDAGILVRGT
ncbi:hypothetical protein JXA88_06015 [Candidatus Fermentibacteria bacterium]|nr:hypothetical protein [Candidatus Fermentibacteria bacterium]